MKKIISILAAFVLALTLTACSTFTPQIEKTMVIKPSELSEETLSVLEFVDEDIFFFDFITNDTIKSYTIEVWIYEDEKWKDYGNTSGNIDTANNRIAFKITDTGYDIKTSNKSGFTGYSSDAAYNGFDNAAQTGSYKLTSPTPILADTEIILWSKIGNNENGMSSAKDFRNVNCTAGMTFTITFSTETLK